MKITRTTIAMVASAMVLSACGDCGGGGSSSSPEGGSVTDARRPHGPIGHSRRDGGWHGDASVTDAGALAPLRGRPRSLAELPTTPGAEALAAVDALANGTVAGDAGAADSAKTVQALVDRFRARGDLEDLARALVAIDRAIATDPRLAIHHATRARILVDLHRVQPARTVLARAKELGAANDTVALATADLDWMTGAYAAADAAIRKTADEQPSSTSLLRRARLEHETGDDGAADRSFERAEDVYEGASPFLLAEIYIARGAARLDVGKADEAEVFLREALARVPGHTRAAALLGRALARTGKIDEAIAILDPLAKTTKDPVLLGAFASVLATKKDPRAAGARAKATARADELAKSEDGWLDAGVTFVDAGEGKRALELLEKESKARGTASTLLLVARAKLATSDLPGARAAVEQALKSPIVDARLDWTAARVFSRLGESGKAQELAQRARLRDPRIESEEPPLSTAP